MSTSKDNPDFRLERYGSICFLRPLNDIAESWVNEHIGSDNGYQPNWPDVLVEPRYVQAILRGIADDNLTVGVA